jgi:hypothetical protein
MRLSLEGKKNPAHMTHAKDIWIRLDELGINYKAKSLHGLWTRQGQFQICGQFLRVTL